MEIQVSESSWKTRNSAAQPTFLQGSTPTEAVCWLPLLDKVSSLRSATIPIIPHLRPVQKPSAIAIHPPALDQFHLFELVTFGLRMLC